MKMTSSGHVNDMDIEKNGAGDTQNANGEGQQKQMEMSVDKTTESRAETANADDRKEDTKHLPRLVTMLFVMLAAWSVSSVWYGDRNNQSSMKPDDKCNNRINNRINRMTYQTMTNMKRYETCDGWQCVQQCCGSTCGQHKALTMHITTTTNIRVNGESEGEVCWRKKSGGYVYGKGLEWSEQKCNNKMIEVNDMCENDTCEDVVSRSRCVRCEAQKKLETARCTANNKYLYEYQPSDFFCDFDRTKGLHAQISECEYMGQMNEGKTYTATLDDSSNQYSLYESSERSERREGNNFEHAKETCAQSSIVSRSRCVTCEAQKELENNNTATDASNQHLCECQPSAELLYDFDCTKGLHAQISECECMRQMNEESTCTATQQGSYQTWHGNSKSVHKGGESNMQVQIPTQVTIANEHSVDVQVASEVLNVAQQYGCMVRQGVDSVPEVGATKFVGTQVWIDVLLMRLPKHLTQEDLYAIIAPYCQVAPTPIKFDRKKDGTNWGTAVLRVTGGMTAGLREVLIHMIEDLEYTVHVLSSEAFVTEWHKQYGAGVRITLDYSATDVNALRSKKIKLVPEDYKMREVMAQVGTEEVGIMLMKVIDR